MGGSPTSGGDPGGLTGTATTGELLREVGTALASGASVLLIPNTCCDDEPMLVVREHIIDGDLEGFLDELASPSK